MIKHPSDINFNDIKHNDKDKLYKDMIDLVNAFQRHTKCTRP